jgi:hypothetical protein
MRGKNRSPTISMVKLPRAEPGDTRNIIKWTEGKWKNSRRKEM